MAPRRHNARTRELRIFLFHVAHPFPPFDCALNMGWRRRGTGWVLGDGCSTTPDNSNPQQPNIAGGTTCHHICAFFGEFGFMVQFVLAFFSFSALILKRFQVPPLIKTVASTLLPFMQEYASVGPLRVHALRAFCPGLFAQAWGCHTNPHGNKRAVRTTSASAIKKIWPSHTCPQPRPANAGDAAEAARDIPARCNEKWPWCMLGSLHEHFHR